MEQYISKSALVAEIERLENKLYYEPENFKDVGAKRALDSLKSSIDTLELKEVKEVDIDKLCGFRKNIGFAYPEGASEYQKQLACYRQGIKDAIKAQKRENI